MKTRIIKRTYVNNETLFIIQTRHFRWFWIDASLDSTYRGHNPGEDSFKTLEEAKKNLYRFGGAKHKDEVVY